MSDQTTFCECVTQHFLTLHEKETAVAPRLILYCHGNIDHNQDTFVYCRGRYLRNCTRHRWRKYGQKTIGKEKQIRSYYKCPVGRCQVLPFTPVFPLFVPFSCSVYMVHLTCRTPTSIQAKKQVEIQADFSIVTYDGTHSNHDLAK